MSSTWTKCDGKCPCGLSDFVDVRYPDGEETHAVAAGGMPWGGIAEWRFSEPWSSVQNAYIEGFAHGFGGEETYARSVAYGNWTRSQSHDDALEALLGAEEFRRQAFTWRAAATALIRRKRIDLTDDMVVAAMAHVPGCDHDDMVSALQAAIAKADEVS